MANERLEEHNYKVTVCFDVKINGKKQRLENHYYVKAKDMRDAELQGLDWEGIDEIDVVEIKVEKLKGWKNNSWKDNPEFLKVSGSKNGKH